MRQAQRPLSLSSSLPPSLSPRTPPSRSLSLPSSVALLSLSFYISAASVLRSAEVGKANPVLRVAQRRIMVYEGKRAGREAGQGQEGGWRGTERE